MHYQLFVPHTVGDAIFPAQQALENLGLGDFVAGHEGRQSPGPPDDESNEQRGILIAWRKPGANQKFHYNANEQTWIPAVPNGPEGEGKGRYWVGFWNDDPPTPDDLQRPYAHAGPAIRLGDGRDWRIPRISDLPTDYILADDGSWKFEIQRQYHGLWLESEDWLKRIFGDDSPDIEISQILDYCQKVLRQNYRILPEVASRLRLLNSTNVVQVLHAALGLVPKESGVDEQS